ncbi:hypothetical protein D9M71_664150 [compost metagenome]
MLAHQGTDQLVEGVVPADIFTAQQDLALIVHEQRRMHRAAMLAQGLESIHALAQAFKPARWRQRRAGQHG